MDAPIVAAYEYPLSVDHPHQRRNQHNSLLGVLSRRHSNEKAYPNHPDVDVSDCDSYYRIDLEVPGVKNPKALAIQWTGWRHLNVCGATLRPMRRLGQGASSAQSSPVEEGGNGRNDPEAYVGHTLTRSPKHGESRHEKEVSSLVIGERKIGTFNREFFFAVDVDMERLSAKLDAGLLTITIPKIAHSLPQGSGTVEVQGADHGAARSGAECDVADWNL